MLEVVIGRGKNILGQQQLQHLLKGMNLNGTLYLAYPVIASSDQMIMVDSLLTCLEHGVVIIDFKQTDGPGAIDELREHQDDLYNALQRKLLQYKPLLNGRKLAVHVNVLTFVSDEAAARRCEGAEVVGPESLASKLASYSAIDDQGLRLVNAAIQRVGTIKPTTKRTNVQQPTSRGAIIQRIEKEIANLDQWQKRAAIETPDGPQRVRGLAGSGKTVVLALKAAYLHSANPEWDIAVTFNTRALYQQFKDLVRRFCFDHTEDEPNWSKLRIMHAWGSSRQPGLYAEIAAANDLPVKDFNYAKLNYTYETAFEGVCDELLTSLRSAAPKQLFDAILIDEAQDLPRSFFEICYLSGRNPNRVAFAYDELQNLGAYSMAPPAELFGVGSDGNPRVPNLDTEEDLPRRDIVLPVCYRNTPWALTTAHAVGFGIYRKGGLIQFFENAHLLEDVGYRVRSGSLEPGKSVELERSRNSFPPYFQELISPDDAVQWYPFEDSAQQADWIAANIQKNLDEDELRHTDILVIVPNALKSRDQAATIMEALGKLGIASHLAGVTSSVDTLYQESSIAISGIYRAKGNEAAMVYISHSEYASSPFISVRARNVLFTAITRSRAWVRLCGIGAGMATVIEELEQVKQHQYHLAFNVPTEAQLDKMRKIHRDRTDTEVAQQRDALKELENLVAMVESGDLPFEAIPEDLKRRLVILTGAANDSE
ncbi:MAG: ATP-binding domain-containing protein [Terracidiphilus sp.]